MIEPVSAEEFTTQTARRSPDQFQYVKFRMEYNAARITLARPEHNLLNEAMLREIVDAIAYAGDRPEAKLIVLDSACKVFSGGIDIAIRKHRNHAILRVESQEQRLRCPQKPHFRRPLRIAVQTLPIRIEPQRRRNPPSGIHGKPLRINPSDKSHRRSCFCFHRICLRRLLRFPISIYSRRAPPTRPHTIHPRIALPPPRSQPLSANVKLFAHAPISPPQTRQIAVLASIVGRT